MRDEFKFYYSRLKRESIVNSVLYAIVVGFSSLFIFSFILWLLNITQLWISIVLSIISIFVAIPLFYFKKFYPTIKETAKRLDKFGLDERIITMQELWGSDSYIAQIQREDALNRIKDTNNFKFKNKSVKKLSISTTISAVLGIFMSTILSLTVSGILPPSTIVHGEEIPTYYMISYVEGDGYIIEGESDQAVLENESTTEVAVKCEDGWVFVQWICLSNNVEEDKYLRSITRHEENVSQDMIFYALCVEIESSDSNGGEGEGDSESKPTDDEAPLPDGLTPPPAGDPSTGAGESQANQDNNVIDEDYNQVDYSQIYDNYYEQIRNELSGNLDNKDFYEGYFNGLKK